MDLTDVPGGSMLKSLQWACANWRVATELRLTLASRLRNADAEAARALFKDENAPKQVKKLLLSVIGQHHHADVMPCLVDCEVFPWLLNSISGIETLLLELYHPVPSLTHLTALKHIALYGYDGYGALSSMLPLPSLESLELNGRSGRHSDDDMYFDAEFDLQSLQRLQWLGLSYFLPVSLTLPSACRVALSTTCGIYNEDYNEEDHTAVWHNTGQQVYSLKCMDDSDCGRFDFSLLELFPNIEQFSVESEAALDLGVGPRMPERGSVDIDLSRCPPLQFLSHLRISFVAAIPESTITVVIPGHLPLKTLMVLADNLILGLESPQETGSRLEKLIVGSSEQAVQIFGLRNSLMEAVASTGMALGRAVANRNGRNPYRRVCFYTKVPGVSPKSYRDLVEEMTGCFCEACWECLKKQT
jgi:hypothetical protein